MSSRIELGRHLYALVNLSRSILLVSCAIVVLASCTTSSDTATTRDAYLEPHVPNILNGAQLFKSEGCSACHSTGTRNMTGPGLAGIGTSAASRIPTLTAEQYLQQSIQTPGVYVVDGFRNLMPKTYSRMPTNDLQDLIAYLKTLN